MAASHSGHSVSVRVRGGGLARAFAGDRIPLDHGWARIASVDPFGGALAWTLRDGHHVMLRWVRGSWAEAGRHRRRPARTVIPRDLTDDERSAWAALARCYSHLTDTELAHVLPGWDDVRTFEPPRHPGARGGALLWPFDGGPLEAHELPPMRRASLLVRAIRRWARGAP